MSQPRIAAATVLLIDLVCAIPFAVEAVPRCTWREVVPVTVIEVLPNRVTQVKTQDKDGYRAVQVTFGTRRQQLYSKAVNGHYAKAKVAPGHKRRRNL